MGFALPQPNSPPMDLSGPQKAVLMLLSLDESVATPIIAELDPA